MTRRKSVAAALIAAMALMFCAALGLSARHGRPELRSDLRGAPAVFVGSERTVLPRRHDIPTIVLYVRAGCEHCAAELARWKSIAAEDTTLARRTDIAIVRDVDRIDSAASGLPGATAFADPHGAFGRAMGISGVPTTLYVRPDGSVDTATVGETAPKIVRRRWSRLASDIDAERGR